MADKVRFEQNRMELMASRFDADSQTIKSTLDRLEKDLDLVATFWKGEASEKFYIEYEAAQKTMIEIYMELEKVGKNIHQAARTLSEEDMEIARRTRKSTKTSDAY